MARCVLRRAGAWVPGSGSSAILLGVAVVAAWITLASSRGAADDEDPFAEDPIAAEPIATEPITEEPDNEQHVVVEERGELRVPLAINFGTVVPDAAPWPDGGAWLIGDGDYAPDVGFGFTGRAAERQNPQCYVRVLPPDEQAQPAEQAPPEDEAEVGDQAEPGDERGVEPAAEVGTMCRTDAWFDVDAWEWVDEPDDTIRFRVDVPNGEYDVAVVVGDVALASGQSVAASGDGESWIPIADDLWSREEFLRARATVSVTRGHLELRFGDENGHDEARTALGSLRITPSNGDAAVHVPVDLDVERNLKPYSTGDDGTTTWADVRRFDELVAQNTVTGTFTFAHMGVHVFGGLKDGWPSFDQHFPTWWADYQKSWLGSPGADPSPQRLHEVTLQAYAWDITSMASGDALPPAAAGWLQRFAAEMDAWLNDNPSATVVIRLMHEMNGQWVDTINGGAGSYFIGRNDPELAAAYVESWRRIHDLVEGATASPDRVQWLWGPNAYAAGSTTNSAVDPAAAYPGDAYVDLVGVSWYASSTHGFQSAAGPHPLSLETQAANLRAIAPSKPIGVSEGSIEKSLVDLEQRWVTFWEVMDSSDFSYFNFWYVDGKRAEPAHEFSLEDVDPAVVEAWKRGYLLWLAND